MAAWERRAIRPRSGPRAAAATAVAVTLVVVATAGPVAGQERSAAGRIKLTSGEAFIIRQSTQLPARTGQALFEADVLRTGADGRVGLTLKDETRLSLGPNSEVQLEKFLFAPSDGQLAFVARFVRGIATYVSGRIAKLSPDAVRLETPTAIIGVRGTRLAIRVETK